MQSFLNVLTTEYFFPQSIIRDCGKYTEKCWAGQPMFLHFYNKMILRISREFHTLQCSINCLLLILAFCRVLKKY